MESNLINIKTENGFNSVSARELHAKLEIKTQYKDWFPRMCEYGFEENIDFIAIAQKRATAQGNKTTFTEHFISLDMAKEICMIQRSEIGKKFRQYFIECEKKLKNIATPKLTFEEMTLKVIDECHKRISDMSKLIESQKPKVAAHDLLINTTDLVSMRVCAKEIKVPEKKFITYLLENGFLYRDGHGKLIPYAKPKVNGLFDVKTIFSPDGQHTYYQTMVTPEGLAYFAKHTQSMTQGV